MTKVFKNLLILLCSFFAFLGAGFFFVGCDVNYDAIKIVSDKDSVELNVGESADIIFEIQNYSKKFSNILKVSQTNGEGLNAQYKYSEPVYLEENKIKVTVTAEAGGNGQLRVYSPESAKLKKECFVDIYVKQYSKTLQRNDDVFYVSNKTPFKPTNGSFIYDNNTTEQNLSHFYLNLTTEIDFSKYFLKSIDFETNNAIFEDGNTEVSVEIKQVDELYLKNEDAQNLYISFQGIEEKIDYSGSEFKLMSVYDYSIDNAEYSRMLYTLSKVYILPDLNFSIAGGYLNDEGYADFKPIEGTDIKIVPNNNNMLYYMFKVEMNSNKTNEIIDTEISASNDNIVFDYARDYQEAPGAEAPSDNVFYFKVMQNSQSKSTTEISLNVFYNIAQNVTDDSVNINKKYNVNVDIAPTQITINDNPEPDTFVLYNYYNKDASNFGWQQFLVGVLSGFVSSPSYDGVYFEFDTNLIEMSYSGNRVYSGNKTIYKNLDVPFFIRGAQDVAETETVINVHLLSDILYNTNELILPVRCKIVKGATIINVEQEYIDNDEFYIDFSNKIIEFNHQLFADQKFKNIDLDYVSGDDVVSIERLSIPYIKADQFYYLNFNLSVKKEGRGTYIIHLDNGVSYQIVFVVLKTLKDETTSIKLSNKGNESVTNYYFSKDNEELLFDNVLNIEILNSSDKDNVTYGNKAFFEIFADVSKNNIQHVLNKNGVILVNRNGFNYEVITGDNGQVTITITLTGSEVENFSKKTKDVNIYVNVYSYSLVSEFYMMNGDSYALNNVVYHGVKTDASKTSVSPYVKNSKSNNFYQYSFSEDMFINAFNSQENGIYDENIYNVDRNDINLEMVYSQYKREFIYFHAESKYVSAYTTDIIIIKTTPDGEAPITKKIKLIMDFSLMFYSDSITFEEKDIVGDVIATYEVQFTNKYSIGLYGMFNMEDFSYTDSYSEDYELVLSSNIRQRDLTKKYDVNIISLPYKTVETISLASSITKFDYSNDKLVYEVGVYLNPLDATNNKIAIEYIPTLSKYAGMVLWDIKKTDENSGVYTIRFSCEKFYHDYNTSQVSIVDIEDDLSGKIYIYPKEWGDSYSSLTSRPICIDVKYRNGSIKNPYLLETAEDVVAINTNETTLKSNYEIRNVIDMSSVKNMRPIGIINENELVGFSGTINGTTNQSSIVNISINNENFYANAKSSTGDFKDYYGLFAKINEKNYKIVDGEKKYYSPRIENVAFSGKIDVVMRNDSYISLLSCVNAGDLINVGTKILESQIKGVKERTLYYGAVSSVNLGYIIQNFTKYESDAGKYSGQNGHILAEYDGTMTINAESTIVFAGGIVGASNGTIRRYKSSKLKLYGYSAYSSMVDIKLVGVNDESNSNKKYNVAYLGGAAGVVAYNKDITNKIVLIPEIKAIPVSEMDKLNSVHGLLVGGTIDTQGSYDYKDYIGGIVGFTSGGLSSRSTQGESITISANISRTFLRGYEFVGGIAGYDDYINGEIIPVNYTEKNTYESIDDGRSAFFASSIIKYKNDLVEPEKDDISKNAYFAVGNSLVSSKLYSQTVEGVETSSFIVRSYLKRRFLNASPGDFISSKNDSKKEYYGDYIIAEKQQGTTYNILKAYQFVFKDIDLNIGSDSPFKMTSNAQNGLDVYFMYYFDVDSDINGKSGIEVDKNISELNNVSPNSQKLYPFTIESEDVSISSSSSNILSIDYNGNIKVEGVGLVEITLSSILNIVDLKKIYVYVVNYFDKDTTSSIFYSRVNNHAIEVKDKSSIIVRGETQTKVEMIPSYHLDEILSSSGENEHFSISKNGILTYKNVSYLLKKNTQITIDQNGMKNGVESDYFSAVQLQNQTIIFYKNDENNISNTDKYILKPVLKTVINTPQGKFEYYYVLDNSIVNLDVNYKESATRIGMNFARYAMDTNNMFADKIFVESTDENEVLFYQIFDSNGVCVQNRLPDYIGQISKDNWYDYINYEKAYAEDKVSNKNPDFTNRLFELHFERSETQTNVFNFTCKIDDNGELFNNRFNKSIFGDYTVHFYCTELNYGVTSNFEIVLSEAEIDYISIDNYSNIRDLVNVDNVVIPSQRGLLEITLDPIEAVFSEIRISNNKMNSAPGATNAIFSFVYEKIKGSNREYVVSENFGIDKNGVFTFTYKDLKEFYAQLNEQFTDFSVVYSGKLFISYYMPSYNVKDSIPVAFDVEVLYGNNAEKKLNSSIMLNTKLNSYAKLSFADKLDANGNYYVARGLSYDLKMESSGFTEDQILVTSTNSDIVSIEKNNGKYSLKVTPNAIHYNDDLGFKVFIETTATKIVDGVLVVSKDIMTVYVMEYVFNYVYEEGRNLDIVEGMENGNIYTAVGNPYRFELDIKKMVEYDRKNKVVEGEVNTFVNNFKSNVNWNVHYDNSVKSIDLDTVIKTDYFYIEAMKVTPTRIYKPESNIYHFSAELMYKMKNGVYISTKAFVGSNKLYTEFSFEVHQQSTENSPIPVESYEDFLNMKNGEWYILLNDIELPNIESAVNDNSLKFKPVNKEIAGFDGNGYRFLMSGNYKIDLENNIGIFGEIAENSIVKNVIVQVVNDVVVNIDSASFNFGLLAGVNNGIVTNCHVESLYDKSVSVIHSNLNENSYVAGLIAYNTGYVTHSRSKVNLFSSVNLSGFIGYNSGVIASSYYAEASLRNETAYSSEYTAGFVINNSGRIYTSFVSGKKERDSIFYNKAENNIKSSNNVSAFVYSNSGDVSDCYSNILIGQSGAFTSGFVFENSGSINRCISTSVLGSNQTSNYGFARSNYILARKGVIKDCFYLASPNAKVFDENGLEKRGVNQSISTIVNDEYTEITEIDCGGNDNGEFDLNNNGFAKFDYFTSFAAVDYKTINSVWFMSKIGDSMDSFNGSIFNSGRLELVAPNIIAYSRKNLDRIENVVDKDTGASYSRYVYVYDTNSPQLGSIYNPILINDAASMENYMQLESDASKVNRSSYRIISNINYSEYQYNSELYKIKFLGYLEGNFMDISEISLISSAVQKSAGLFARIGSSVSANLGTVMNLSINPRVISFGNTEVVGGIAGIVDAGTIINIDCRVSNSDLVVSGNNIVGGIVGLALGNYNIKNVNSTFNVKARSQKVDGDNSFSRYLDDYSGYSFAGGVAGVLSGVGKVEDVHISSSISALANKVGLVFGCIDSDVLVKNVILDMKSNSLLNSYGGYAGLVVGESKGTVRNVVVNGADVVFDNIKNVPFKAVAVGGYAGLVSGGKIIGAKISQSISVSSDGEDDGILSLGGLAGEVSESVKIIDVEISKILLRGFKNVGGLIGTVNTNSSIVEIEGINVDSCNIEVLAARLKEVSIGGVVGLATKFSIISLDRYSPNELDSVESGTPSIDENIVSFNVLSNIFASSNNVKINLGGILGKNENVMTQMFNATEVYLTAVCSALNLSNDYKLYEGMAKVQNTEDGIVFVPDVGEVNAEGSGDAKPVIDSKVTFANGCSFYCDVKFKTVSKFESIQSSNPMDMILSLDGIPVIPGTVVA